MRKAPRLALLIGVLLSCTWSVAAVSAADWQIRPADVTLEGRFSRAQLLTAAGADDAARAADLTHSATYESSDPGVVVVDGNGRLEAIADGQATIRVTVGDATQEVPVVVRDVATSVVEFARDVTPILNKLGCAGAACHASQYGKGGFKLSVFGFDPDADHEAIARAGRQRRVSLASPTQSLVLMKPAMQLAHGGGRRFDPESVEYRTLESWIAHGAPRPDKDSPAPARLEVEPTLRIGAVGESQQMRVVIHYADDSTRDVSALARFDSTDDGVLGVDVAGRVTLVGEGQAAVMVRYEGLAQLATFVTPYGGPEAPQPPELAEWQSRNFVDELAVEKFRQLRLAPSPVCDDATFVRRAFLDAIGTLPTAEQAREFVESTAPDKRERLVDQLLGLAADPAENRFREPFAAYWTLKWSDLLGNKSTALGEQGMWSLHNWIRESFRQNKPFDQFVRELVTAQGSIYSTGPANYFRIYTDANTLTESTAQLFLGVRLECAKCHHHPFEKYGQEDYYGLAAFFARVGTKNSEEFGLFGRESVVTVRATGEVSHPKTGKRMEPTPLGGEPVEDPLDRRVPLAQWLTSSDNEFFARAVVNRYVSYLLGRGLVEPVDDMRSTNPPSNPELLDALAKDFVASGYDLRRLMRAIMTSRLYQLSSQPTAGNAGDRRFFSHYHVKRLTAEPLLDAIDLATGAPTKFRNLPLGTRAIELPDAEYPDHFLTTFAKPKRASVCECERSPDASLAQALHTLNGDTLTTKIANSKGRLATLLADKRPHEEIVAELYWATLSRAPSDGERQLADRLVQESPSPKEAYEDLLWALLNSKQFLFVR